MRIGEDLPNLAGGERLLPPHAPGPLPVQSRQLLSRPDERDPHPESQDEQRPHQQQVLGAHRLRQQRRDARPQHGADGAATDHQRVGALGAPRVQEHLRGHEELGHQRGGEEVVPAVEDQPHHGVALRVQQPEDHEVETEEHRDGRDQGPPTDPVRQAVVEGHEEQDHHAHQVDLVELPVPEAGQGQRVPDRLQHTHGRHHQEEHPHQAEQTVPLFLLVFRVAGKQTIEDRQGT